MNNINHIQVLFSLMTLFMIILSSLMNSFEIYLPSFIRQFYRYGKYSFSGNKTFVHKTEVPKSWFKHFYIYSAILLLLTLALSVRVYIFNVAVPRIVIDVLNFTAGEDQDVYVSSASVLLALALLTVQCWRRLYDTHCVSVFSQNGRINLSHYLVGYIHYTGAVFAILAAAPKFRDVRLYARTPQWSDLTYLQLGAAALFLWSCWHQYNVTVILANLRKDKKGAIVTQAHKLPHGDWFNYVSSPHNLAEILMYTALTIILWKNITWLYILAWVLSNQIATSLMTHWWYQEKFSDLPKNRKAIIPFIY